MENLSEMNGLEIVQRLKILKLDMGAYEYEKAKELAQPYIDELNKRGRIIAKKHGQTYSKITFAGFGRR